MSACKGTLFIRPRDREKSNYLSGLSFCGNNSNKDSNISREHKLQKTTSSTDVASSNPNSKYPLIVNVLSGDWGLQLKTSNATITVNLYFRGKDSVNVFIRDYKPALGLAILEYCCHYTIVQADDNGKVFLILMKGISCNLNEEPTSFLSTAKLENNLITMELNLEGEGVIDISGKKSTSPQNK